MVTNEQAVDQLNMLIQTNVDRQEGYKKALENIEDPSLKELFEQYRNQSEQNVASLSRAVESLGGEPNEKTTFGGDVYRAWMDWKDTMTTNERKSTLASCERGEDTAVASYKKVINEPEVIDNNLLVILSSQFRDIEDAHDRIKNLRDSA